MRYYNVGACYSARPIDLRYILNRRLQIYKSSFIRSPSRTRKTSHPLPLTEWTRDTDFLSPTAPHIPPPPSLMTPPVPPRASGPASRLSPTCRCYVHHTAAAVEVRIVVFACSYSANTRITSSNRSTLRKHFKQFRGQSELPVEYTAPWWPKCAVGTARRSTAKCFFRGVAQVIP